MKTNILTFLILVVFLSSCDKIPPPPAPFGPVPSERQLKWHELEVIGMVNFSTITYYGKEWGYGDEDPAKFNPTEFDALQIISAAKSGGIKGLIIDAKHHGGFCLWPSKYNDTYTVKNSPWRNGKGDMVKELVDACRTEDLEVAMYLSPWDRNHKDYGKEEYVTYYHNQWEELLTNYGPIFEVWFDGANGGDGWYGGAKENRKIDRRTYYQFDKLFPKIRKLQPDACIFSELGPELRWVGNESGYAGDPCWASYTPRYRGTQIPVKFLPETGLFEDFPNGESNYIEATNGHRNGALWIPAETDFPLRHGWFWHPDGQGRHSSGKLVDLYFQSVGLNTIMDIGIAPDRRGLIDDYDLAVLKGFGDRIEAIFKTNLAQNAKATASNIRGNNKIYAAANVLNGKSKFKTYWATDDSIKDAELVLDFDKPVEFSVISLREAIQFGHRVDDWALDSWENGQWMEFASGTCIGARRLWRGQPITSAKIRLRIIKSSASPAISEFAVYLEPEISRAEAGKSISHMITGISKTNWKVVSATSEGKPSANAIDNNTGTFWDTNIETGSQPLPQEIVVDMGKPFILSGFLYTPRQDNIPEGNVSRYAFYISIDGKNWGEPVSSGEFGNIKAKPDQQKVLFENSASGQFFKFVALGSADGDFINVAEVGVLKK